MVKLPTREDLGGIRVSTGGPARIQDASGAYRGQYDLGKGIQAVGAALLERAQREQQEKNKDEEFIVEKGFQQFQWGQQQALTQSMQDVKPGEAAGFTDKWASEYDKNALEFLSKVPERLQTKYDLRLLGTRQSLYGSASTFSTGEQKRYSIAELEDMRNNIYFPRIASGGNIDSVIEDYRSAVGTSAYLTPIEKDKLFRSGASELEKAHVRESVKRGVDIKSVINDIRGGMLDTDVNPETRAKPFPFDEGPTKISAEGLDFIKRTEGFAPEAKFDYRQYSVGYGTKGAPGERITKDEAERRLIEETSKVDDFIAKNVTVKLTQAQHDSLVSFGFNLGTDDIEKLLPDINSGNFKRVSERMKQFNNVIDKQTGKLVPSSGLTKRRQKESEAFAAGETSSLPAKKTQQYTWAGPYRYLDITDRQSLIKEAETAFAHEVAKVRESVRTIEGMAEKGYSIPADQLETLKARVERTNDPDTSASFRQATAMLEFQQKIRQVRPEELDAFIRAETERLHVKGASPIEVKRLELSDKLLTTMRQELKQDPLGWADRVGLTKIAPIDFTSLEAARTSLTARVQQANEVAAMYNEIPRYLRPDEKHVLQDMISQGGDQTLSVAATIAAAAGKNSTAIIKEVFKNSPSAAAIIGVLVSESGAVVPAAKDAANGLYLRKQDGFKSFAPDATKARSAAVEILGSALAAAEDTESALIDAANAVYETRHRRANLTDFDPAVWQQGLIELTGENKKGDKTYGGVVDADPSWWGVRRIILPPNVSQDNWRTIIDSLTLNDLNQAGLGSPVSNEGIGISLSRLKNALIVQVDMGKYALSLGNPDVEGEEQWIKRGDQPGKPLLLDFEKLKPFIMKRHPGLYSGE